MKVTALASWFGGNRMLGSHVGRLLGKCSWVGVPFMGGGPELAHIQCRTGVANDLHRHVINLAAVCASPRAGPLLYRRLRRWLFHPVALAAAQDRCRERDRQGIKIGLCVGEDAGQPDATADAVMIEELVQWAEDYFVCVWMARNGTAGTDGEFDAGLSFRWEAGGGDSVVRFRGAVEGLKDWRRVLAKWTFDCRDAFEFLAKCKDQKGHGLYVDAPWPDDGDGYRHGFTDEQQRRLAEVLAGYRETRVVVRFGDHPLIRELYPEPLWRWHRFQGRTAANKAKAEVLITSFAS